MTNMMTKMAEIAIETENITKKKVTEINQGKEGIIKIEEIAKVTPKKRILILRKGDKSTKSGNTTEIKQTKWKMV